MTGPEMKPGNVNESGLLPIDMILRMRATV